jgi:hypothetical protein
MDPHTGENLQEKNNSHSDENISNESSMWLQRNLELAFGKAESDIRADVACSQYN